MRRIIAITAGLAAAGALFGAVVATLVVTLWLAVTGSIRGGAAPFLMAAGFGAGLGAVLGPLAAWTLMRHVPLWRAMVGTAVGTAVGAIAGISVQRLGGPDLMLVGSLVGFSAAAIGLRVRHRQKA